MEAIRAGVGLGLALEMSGSDPCWGWFGSGTGNEWKRSVLGLGLSPEYTSINDKELGENKEKDKERA